MLPKHAPTLVRRHIYATWWPYQMETFSALLALCEGNPPVTGEFPAQRPVTRSFDVFFDLRLNKRLSKQSRRGWFETPSRSVWRHCNGLPHLILSKKLMTITCYPWCIIWSVYHCDMLSISSLMAWRLFGVCIAFCNVMLGFGKYKLYMYHSSELQWYWAKWSQCLWSIWYGW